ncbi:MAG TPA: DinB family protein [Candidatus Acidoferrales bacterium]|nr:DinB family protein [Candidatus Acidoferrales bacterium]
MRRTVLVTLFLILVATATAAAQTKPAPAASGPSPSEVTLRAWNAAYAQLIEMAEDFPEDKYDYKPKPEVRTFAEQLLHVAGSPSFFIAVCKGEQRGEEDFSREKYKTKAEVVAALKKAAQAGADFIREQGDTGLNKPAKLPWESETRNALWVWNVGARHAGEHYGQLVVYYRLNGIVPPASR